MAPKRKKGKSSHQSLAQRPSKVPRVQQSNNQNPTTIQDPAVIQAPGAFQTRNGKSFLDLPVEIRTLIYAYATNDIPGDGWLAFKRLTLKPEESPPVPDWQEQKSQSRALLQVSSDVRAGYLPFYLNKVRIQFADADDFIACWFGSSWDAEKLSHYSGRIEVYVPMDTKKDRPLVDILPLIHLIRGAPTAKVIVSEPELNEFLHSTHPTWLNCLDSQVESIQVLANFEFKTVWNIHKIPTTSYPPTIDIRFLQGCEPSWVEQGKQDGGKAFKSFMTFTGLDQYQRWGFRLGFSLEEKLKEKNQETRQVDVDKDWGPWDWVMRKKIAPSLYVREGDEGAYQWRVYW